MNHDKYLEERLDEAAALIDLLIPRIYTLPTGPAVRAAFVLLEDVAIRNLQSVINHFVEVGAYEAPEIVVRKPSYNIGLKNLNEITTQAITVARGALADNRWYSDSHKEAVEHSKYAVKVLATAISYLASFLPTADTAEAA